MSERNQERLLTDEMPCFGCPNLQRVESVAAAKVMIHCSGQCPEVAAQVSE